MSIYMGYMGAPTSSFCRVALKRGKGDMKSPDGKILREHKQEESWMKEIILGQFMFLCRLSFLIPSSICNPIFVYLVCYWDMHVFKQ